jgi:hypothetical protein
MRFFCSKSKSLVAVGLSIFMVGLCSAGETVSFRHPGLYAEVGGGGYYRNMRDDSVIGAQNKVTHWKEGRMGWQAGFDVGYRFWKTIAAEFGFFWLQNQKMIFNAPKTYSGVPFGTGSTIELKSWATYLAGRADFDIALDWGIYGKLGLAYVNNQLYYHPISAGNSQGSGSLWSPYFGFGVLYHLSQHWLLSLDYALIFGNNNNDDPYYSNRLSGSSVHIPSLQRLTLNVGYFFQI